MQCIKYYHNILEFFQIWLKFSRLHLLRSSQLLLLTMPSTSNSTWLDWQSDYDCIFRKTINTKLALLMMMNKDSMHSFCREYGVV